MGAFFLTLVRFVRSFRRGLQDPEFRALLYVMLALLFVGTIFYWRIERWSVIDSLYFCIVTLSTIGYGDLYPTTNFSRIFTSVYVLVGIGVFVTFVTKVASYGMRMRTGPFAVMDDPPAPDHEDPE